MATKNTFSNLSGDLSERLLMIKSMVEVCGFACEARRVLNDIDEFLERDPNIETRFSNLIEARNEWRTHDDSVALVLKDLARQIEAVNRRLTDPEVHRDIENA